MRISKLSIGVRPSNKMFRIGSIAGTLIDKVLDLRGQKPIENTYFTEVTRSMEQGSVTMKNESESNVLTINFENILFTKNFYSTDKRVDVDKALGEFHVLWKVINSELAVKDIRRIGIVAEHRFSTEKDAASRTILKSYTNLNTTNHPAKVMIQMEDRKLTKEGGIPDPKKSNFINVIRHYYDSQLDTEHPEDDKINVNIDVQQYYAPLLNGGIYDEVIKLRKIFEDERKLLAEELKIKGIAQ